MYLTKKAALRCTQYSLEAFGITDDTWTPACVRTGIDTLDVLKKHGWKYQPLYIDGRFTINNFVSDNRQGKFIVGTRGHSIAIIDGVVHDFANGNGKAIVEVVVEVYKQNPVYPPFSTYTYNKQNRRTSMSNTLSGQLRRLASKIAEQDARNYLKNIWQQLDSATSKIDSHGVILPEVADIALEQAHEHIDKGMSVIERVLYKV